MISKNNLYLDITPIMSNFQLNYFQRLDMDESGAIEFDEFICLMEERVKQREEADKQVFIEAFNVFDKDGNGLITADELR